MSFAVPPPLALQNGFFNTLGNTLMNVAGQFFDGATLALPAGTFAVGGTINLVGGAVSATMSVRLIQDGSPFPFAQVEADSPVGADYVISLSPRRIILAAATTVRLQAMNPTQTTSQIRLCPDGTGTPTVPANPSTWITAIPCE